MIANDTIPQNYIGFKHLIFCSNTLRDVRVPIRVNGFPVLLIGGNGKLATWLAAPLNKEATQWRYIVEGDVVAHPGISLVVYEKLLSVTYLTTDLLRVERISEEKAIVRQVDLRPLGLSIYGNDTELHVAGATLSNNSFASVDTMIGIGR